MEDKKRECIEIIALETGLACKDAVQAFENFSQLAINAGKAYARFFSYFCHALDSLNSKNYLEKLKKMKRKEKYLRRVRFKRK